MFSPLTEQNCVLCIIAQGAPAAPLATPMIYDNDGMVMNNNAKLPLAAEMPTVTCDNRR